MRRALIFYLALPALGVGAAASCKSDIGLGEDDHVQASPDASTTDDGQNSATVADDEPDDSTGLFDDVGSLDTEEDAGTPAELVSFDNPPPDAGAEGPAIPDVDFEYTPPDPEEADNCAEVEVEATLTRAPADIIFVIDNSGSMSDEISEVQDQINDNFASIIEDSGLDFRVIMVSRYGEVNVPIGGSANPICVSSPLSNSDCSDPLNTPLENNPPTFYHYSANVESHDAWCVLREGLTRSDEFTLSTSPGLGTRDTAWTPLAPNGYGEWLREGVAKSIVVITDESPGGNNGCYGPSGKTVAEEFDRDIREAAPEQFGPYNGPYDEQHPDTEAVVWDSVLEGSGDKGISIGEGSALLVVNDRFAGDAIGIQAKDTSQAVVVNSTFEDNALAVDAYKKNWRYGDGGQANAECQGCDPRSSAAPPC